MKTFFLLPISTALIFSAAIISQAAPRYIDSDAKTGTSLAVVADNVALAHTSQFLPLDRNGDVVGKADAAKQVEQTLENLSAALRPAKSRLDRVLKINVYAARADVVAEVEKVFAKKFTGEAKPAVSFVVGGLAHPDALVAMDAVAECDDETAQVKTISVDGSGKRSSFAHASILPKGGVVYVSGQAKPGELSEATAKTLESLQETLTFLGLKKSDVVQLKCFIHPIAQTGMAKEQIAKFFAEEPIPPIIFVDWISPKLPIEIELIAAAPENLAAEESISYITPTGFQPSNVYSKVARVNYGKLVYVSGLYGNTAQDAEKQVLEIFDSLKRVVTYAGSDFDSLAKATYYVSDAQASNKLNELRPKFYDPKRPPAASKAMVKGVGREGMSVTFDMIAVSDK